MPEFAYTARTTTGEDVTGTITAANKRETLCALADQSLFVLEVEAKRSGQAAWRKGKRVKTQVLATNLAQLADLLQNGVPLLQSLSLLAEQATDARLSEVLTEIRDQVAEGTSLDEAFARHPGVFNELTVSMVRAGSEGAFLEDALKRTASFLELQQELKSRLVGAMAYPAFLAVAGFVVTTVLIVFFVPMFSDLFGRLERQGGGLPLPTIILLGVSDFLRSYWHLAGGGAIVAFFAGRKAWESEAGRVLVDQWKLKIPVAGKVIHGYAVSRFCRVLGTLLRNGVPLLRALEISSESTGNVILERAIRASADNISAGDTLSRPLAECGLVPRSVMAMISIAEESNNLDEVLINIADTIDRTNSRQLDVMVRLVEPLMLLFMGGVVGFILVALLLPVFQASSAM